MTPWDYALRYLPVTIPTPEGYDIQISIKRYHKGDPTPSQGKLWSALNEHLIAQRKKNPGYRLVVRINGAPVSIGDVSEVGRLLAWPFWGKGSPEACQMVLQAAMVVAGVKPERLQIWADDNLGLDCNGIVGNYLWHDVLGNPWNSTTDGAPGPDAHIDDIFQWAAGHDERGAIDDVSQITLNDKYLIARVDGTGRVIGGSKTLAGHLAITQPGELLQRGIMREAREDFDRGEAGMSYNSECQPGRGLCDMVRTVESGGFPFGSTSDGVGRNWMWFVRKGGAKVFVVNRDRLAMEDLVKIAPVRKGGRH